MIFDYVCQIYLLKLSYSLKSIHGVIKIWIFYYFGDDFRLVILQNNFILIKLFLENKC